MDDDLKLSDLDLILESLGYSLKAKEAYDRYPSYEFKREQIAAVSRSIDKVRALRRQLERKQLA